MSLLFIVLNIQVANSRWRPRVPNSEGHNFHSHRQLIPLMALNVWKVTPESAALRLVRTILRDSPSPLTTKEIYNEAVRREARRKYPHPPTVVAGASAQQPEKLVKKKGVVRPPPPSPPHPENSIRSVRCVCIYAPPDALCLLPGLKLTFWLSTLV